jgi:hypothetical protein
MKAFSIFGNWILFVRKRGVSQMAVIYVALIVKGIRTYASVPEVIKPKVKELLEQLELNDLITE